MMYIFLPEIGNFWIDVRRPKICYVLEAEHCSKWEGFWVSVSPGRKNIPQKEDIFGRCVLLPKIHQPQLCHWILKSNIKFQDNEG